MVRANHSVVEIFVRSCKSSKEQCHITVGGVTAVAFNSTNVALGETAEVWFIANSHLYEVTTLRPLESDLHKVLETFEFTQ